MPEQYFNKFADIAALQKQRDEVLTIYKQIKDGILDLNSLGFKIDGSQSIKEIAEAQKQLEQIQQQLLITQNKLTIAQEELAAASAKVVEGNRNVADSNKQAEEGFKDLLTLSAQNSAASKQLADQKRELDKAYKNDAGNATYIRKLAEIKEAQLAITISNESLNKALKGTERFNQAAAGSLDQLRAELNLTLQAFDKLSEAEKASDLGSTVLAQVNKLTEAVKKEEEASGRFRLNVGNYQGSAKIIVSALKDVENEITKLQQKQQGLVNLSKSDSIGFKLQGGAQQLQAVNAQLGFTIQQSKTLNDITSQPKFLNVAGKLGDATQEARFFTKSLIEMEQAGLKDTQVYVDLQAQLAKLTDTIADTRAEVKALSSDTRGFDLFASSVGTLASTFQTAASAAELFNGDNKEIQKSIQKLVAIQNISNGVRQIATDLTTRGTAANKAYAFAQAQVAIFTNASATATARLGAALKLAGIGVVIGLIGFLADKMGLFGGKTEESTGELEKFNEEIDEAKRKLDAFNTALDNTNSLNKIRIDIEGGDEVDKLVQDIVTAQTKLVELQPTVDKAYQKSIDAAVNFQSEATEANKKIADDTEKTYNTLQKEADGYNQFIKESSLKIDLARKTANDKALKEEKEKNKRLAEEAAKRLEQERKAANDLEIFRLELLAEETAATKESGPVRGRIQATQEEFAIRKKIIEKQRDFELGQKDLTGSQLILIAEKAADQLAKLESRTGQEILRIRHDFANEGQAEAESEYQRLQQAEEEKIQVKIDASKKSFSRYAQEQENQASLARAQAANELNEGVITQEEYNAKIENINLESQRRILDNQIRFAEQQVAILKAAGLDTLEAETEIAKAKEELAKLGIDQKKTYTDLEKQLIQDLKDAYFELGRTIANTLNDVISGAFDRRKNELQDLIDKNDELKTAEIERVKQSGDNAQDQAARIAIIEASAQNRREQLERKQRKLDQQKALAERAFKALQIQGDGIQAVAKIKAQAAVLLANPTTAPLAPLALAQIPIVLASTVASLVSLLAIPIPKFWTGVKSSPEGLAEVAERGPELAITPKGKLQLFEKPGLAYLAKGTEIKNAEVTKTIMSGGVGLNVAKATSVDNKGNAELIDAIKGKKSSIKIEIVNTGSLPIETSAWWKTNIRDI